MSGFGVGFCIDNKNNLWWRVRARCIGVKALREKGLKGGCSIANNNIVSSSFSSVLFKMLLFVPHSECMYSMCRYANIYSKKKPYETWRYPSFWAYARLLSFHVKYTRTAMMLLYPIYSIFIVTFWWWYTEWPKSGYRIYMSRKNLSLN